MSLSGEPTLYPKLGEMFKEIRKRGAVSFLVTNGQNPNVIRKFKEDEFPTQITVSTNASNKALFNKWHNSCNKDAWERFLETLDVIKSLDGKVRRVIRMTLVKEGEGETPKLNAFSNMKEEYIKEYSELILKANPDFVHIKGFKSVGYSRERMGYDKQPWFLEIKEFSSRLLEEINIKSGKKYKIGGIDERCCVVMLARNDKELIIKNI
jgi:tRNA wybutosine-synthesizing protein 1